MLLHIIADYGGGDLAFAEVVQRIMSLMPDVHPVLTPVPPFATLAAGFCIAQLGLNSAPSGTIIYHNVAPRADEQQARQDNAGERLAFARLPSGIRVIGVNAGYTFSFLRDEAEEMRWAAAPAGGSQFRSRDLFPQAAAAIALGQPEALADDIAPDAIPDVPGDAVAYVDGYGNLKTTIRPDTLSLDSGSRVRIRIDGRERDALISDGTFEVQDGALSFAPGSSGWTSRSGSERRWMEVFLRGGNAGEEFGRPRSGARIKLTPL